MTSPVRQTRRALRYTADVALVHGRVFTGNPVMKRAQAVAIKGNRIIAVGSDQGVKSLVGKTTRVLDLGGRFVAPGFNDAHVHLIGGGLAMSRVELRGARTLEELAARITAAASQLPDHGWLQGRGWDQTELPGGAYPPIGLLDEAAGGRPAFLFRTDGHTVWANGAALAAAGIDRDTPDPPGGEIVRDASGAPTGILKESAAELVEKIVPRPGHAEQRAAILAALAELRRLGITSVSDFSPADGARLFNELLQESRLTARIGVSTPLTENLHVAESVRDLFPPDNLILRGATLKGFVDGTLGAHTAALIDPYEDRSEERGLAQFEPEALQRLVRRAHRGGFQVALHAIGDRAARMALDALEHLGPEGRTRRHRIEHAEIVDPHDIPRFVASGIVASMQPAQLISDRRWLAERLGSRQFTHAFPWRRLADSGACVVLGSDWPIEPMSPLLGLFGATAALDAEGLPSLGPRADAQLTIDEALTAFTHGPAWATFEEAIKGTIIAGHLADLVVLSDDPAAVPPEQIPGIAVEYTIFDGKVVYSREGAGVET